MKKPDKIESFYGNGDVYVVSGNEAIRYANCNFDAERLRSNGGAEYWVTDSEAVVGFGVGTESKKMQIRCLRGLIKAIQSGSVTTIKEPIADPKVFEL